MAADDSREVGPPLKSARPGDLVTCIFDGVILAVDNEAGYTTLRGNTRGAQHIDWTVKVHWGTQFFAGGAA